MPAEHARERKLVGVLELSQRLHFQRFTAEGGAQISAGGAPIAGTYEATRVASRREVLRLTGKFSSIRSVGRRTELETITCHRTLTFD